MLRLGGGKRGARERANLRLKEVPQHQRAYWLLSQVQLPHQVWSRPGGETQQEGYVVGQASWPAYPHP